LKTSTIHVLKLRRVKIFAAVRRCSSQRAPLELKMPSPSRSWNAHLKVSPLM
jgi:hypothetical protein